jgi:hypothetical protein
MKTIQLLVLIAASTVACACHGAFIQLTRTGLEGISESFSPVFRSRLNNAPSGFGAGVRPRARSFSASVDPDADVGFISGAAFEVGGSSGSRSTQIPVGPANFPSFPPTITINESITINSVTPIVSYVSSTTAPITFVSGPFFQFFVMTPDLTLAFADQFIVTGNYQATGPTQNLNLPFSKSFVRSGQNATAVLNQGVAITPGFNFPATTTIDPQRQFDSRAYAPLDPVLFDGTIDGIPLKAEFTDTFIIAALARIPEPTTAALRRIGAIAASSLGRAARRRRH